MKKKQIYILSALVAVFAILLTLVLLGRYAWGWFEEQEEEYIPPALEEGEAYYYIGNAQVKDVILMYDRLGRADLSQVRIHTSTGENYFFYHNKTGSQDYFLMGQLEAGDQDWSWDSGDLYYPQILDRFGGTFDYTSLYDDTSTMPTMLSAVGTVMIQDRIFPEGKGALTQDFLKKYGLAKSDDPAYFELVVYQKDVNGNYVYVSMAEGDDTAFVLFNPADGRYYYAEEGNVFGAEFTAGREYLTPAVDAENTKRVYVGNPTIDDTAYYIYLEGRNIVYTVSSAYLAEVVGRDMGYYIAPRLVARSESSYANQLTPMLSIYNGKYQSTTGAVVPDGVTVGILIDQLWTVDTDTVGTGSVERKYSVFRALDLTDPALAAELRRVLMGSKVGDAVDILLLEPRLTDSGAQTVTYHITGIEGVYESSGWFNTNQGRVIREGDVVQITYSDGSVNSQNSFLTLTGFLDLSDPSVPRELKDLLIGHSVGERFSLSEGKALTYTYTYDQTHPNMYTMGVSLERIDGVYDMNGNAKDKVDYGTLVTLTYLLKEQGQTVTYTTMTVKIPARDVFDTTEGWTALGYAEGEIYTMRTLAEAIMGLKVGSHTTNGESDVTVEINYPIEFICDFTLYQDAVVEFFTAYEEYLSFGYTNEKDVYTSTSIYDIVSPADKTLYGLDPDAVLEVLRKFENLMGDQTVAVGLNADTMREYGLYAYKLYFEMPFDCYSKTVNDATAYYYKTSLGFTLYISEVQEDGSRYVGTDLYDIVVKVNDGALLDFVEWNFATDWVQNSLVMVSFSDLRSLVFDLNYAEEDYNGVFGFDICIDDAYRYATQYYENGELKTTYDYVTRMYASFVDGGEHIDGATYAALKALLKYETVTNTDDYTGVNYEGQVHTKAGQLVETISNKLRYITRLKNGRDLDEIYGGVKNHDDIDYDGVYYMSQLLYILNTTRYIGEASEDMTQAEIDALLSDPDACTLTIAMTLMDEKGKQHGYTLRLYNYSGHSLVSITNEATGQSSELFYIQARDANKIAKAVVCLSRGEAFDLDSY